MSDIRQDPNFDPFVTQLEEERGLPRGLLRAQVTAESKGRVNAVSPVGAQGVSQFMPATAKQYNVDVSNPWDSMRGQADYMYDLMKKYKGNVEAAISAYNGGHYNALHYSEGADRDPSRVSQKNWDENKRYTGEIMGYLRGGQTPTQQNVAAQPSSDASVDQVEQTIAKMVQDGEGDYTILRKLTEMGLGPTIDMARDKGYKTRDIVDRIGGSATATVRDAQSKAEDKGVVGRAGYASVDAIEGGVLGAKRLAAQASGDQERQAALAAEAEARRNDPYRRAVVDTTAGKIGGALPNLAAQAGIAFATGGSSIPVQMAGMAAVEGASGLIDPDVADADRFKNAATRGAVGGVAGGVGGLISKAAPVVADAGRAGVAKAIVGNVDEAAARAAQQEALGLPASLATVSSRAAGLADKVGRIPGARAFGADKSGAFDEALGRAVTSRAGATGSAIDSAAVREAQQNISKLYGDALDGVAVDVRASFGTPLDDILQSYEKATLPSMRSAMPKNLVDDLRGLAAQGPVDARQLQSIRSSIGAEMASPSAEASTKQALGGIYKQINEALEQNLPAQNLAKFQQANQQYKNLQAMENMVRASNDTGAVTNRQILVGGKQGNKAAFERGNAPYQDVGDALVQGRADAGFLGNVVTPTTVGIGAAMNPSALTALPGISLSANMAMRLLTDPKYLSILQSMTPVQRAAVQRAAAGVVVPAVAQAAQPPSIETTKAEREAIADALRRKVGQQRAAR